MVLYALGATDVDPVAHGFRGPWLDGGGPFPRPLWHVGELAAEPPFTTAWQLAAASAVGASVRLDGDVVALVVRNWYDACAEWSRPPRTVRTRSDLAAYLALGSPQGNALGLLELFDGESAELRPSAHLAFAATRGWPVFAEDVVDWLTAEAGCTRARAWTVQRALRLGSPARRRQALANLIHHEASDWAVVEAFAPCWIPRSVALAEARMAEAAGSALAADRPRALAVRRAIEDGMWREM